MGSNRAVIPAIAAVLVLIGVFVFIALANFLVGGVLILVAVLVILYWQRDIRDIVVSMLMIGLSLGVLLAVFGGVMFVLFGLIGPRVTGTS